MRGERGSGTGRAAAGGVRVRLIAAVVSAAAVVALSACSGGEDPQPAEPVSSSRAPASSEPSPSDTVVLLPTVPEAAREQTPAGAEAAFRYFLDAYAYAFATGDKTALVGRCNPSSTFCSDLQKKIDEMITSQRKLHGGRLIVRGVTRVKGNVDTEVLLRVLLDQESTVAIDVDGRPVATGAPEKDIEADVLMAWMSDHWWVDQWHFPEASD